MGCAAHTLLQSIYACFSCQLINHNSLNWNTPPPPQPPNNLMSAPVANLVSFTDEENTDTCGNFSVNPVIGQLVQEDSSVFTGWLQCGHKCYSHCICSVFRVAEEANFTGRDETTSWTQQQNGNDGGPGAFHRHLQVSFEKESSSEDYLPRSCTMVIPSDLIADLLEVDKNQNLGRLGNSVTGLPENSGKLSSLKKWALKPGGVIIDGLI